MTVHPVFYPQPNLAKEYDILIRKKTINRVSTNSDICWKKRFETCQDIQDYKMILEKYQW